MYRILPRNNIIDVLAHLRDLHRQIRPSDDRARCTLERRELVPRNLLSNLRRTGEHPTLSILFKLPDIFSLMIDGAHRRLGTNWE